MMEQKKIVPKRRFKEFQNTHGWEQRKLGEITSVITKGTTPLDKSGKGEINYVKIENIDSLSGEITISQKISTVEHEGYLRRSQLKEDDILFSIAGTLGRVTSVKLDILPANTNQALAIIRLKTGFLDYIKTYLKGKAVADFIKKNPTVGAQPNLSLEQVGKLEISLPSEKEQEQLGLFFKQLDNLITLHQRKLEKMKALKSAYLFEMFPAEGECKPKRRFTGFTQAWEQRELGEITLKIGSGKTPKGGDSSYVSEGIPLLRSQNVYGDLVDLSDVAYITSQTDEEMKNSRVVKNDVLLNITGASIGRSAVYRLSSYANVNQHVCIVRPTKGYSSEFVQLNLTSPKGQQQINNNQAGGGREGLNFQQIGNMSFEFPSFEEQAQIGNFFSNLDNLITLHQCKLEKLRNIKKAYLNEMFV